MQIGEIAPRFCGLDHTGINFDLCADKIAGYPVVLIFCPNGIANAVTAIDSLGAVDANLRKIGAEVFCISPEPVSQLSRRKDELAIPFTLLSDEDKSACTAYGIEQPGEPVTILLRPNGHILDIIEDPSPGPLAVSVFETRYLSNPANLTKNNIPALILPDVLSAAECQHLIDIYMTEDVDYIEDAAEAFRSTCDVKTLVPDYGRVDRIDHIIKNRGTVNFIIDRVRSRLVPEIRKSFQYEVTSIEGLRIACYTGQRGGKSHGHRDNTNPSVAHRRFAVTINLNGDSFDGGELRFPEYAPTLLKGESGAAMVFSCSMLHEALEVTRGERFALLFFLAGER